MENPVYTIALSLVKYLGVHSSIELIERVGSLEALFIHPKRLLDMAPKLQRRILSQLADPNLLQQAEQIKVSCEALGIRPCCERV